MFIGFSIYLLCQASLITGKAHDNVYRTSNEVSIGVGCDIEKVPPTRQDQKVRGAVRVVKETIPPDIQVISRYDRAGYLQDVSILDNQGNLTSRKIYTLGQLNRLNAIRETTNGNTIEYLYSYDQFGELAQITNKKPGSESDVLWRRVGSSPQSTIEQLCDGGDYERPIQILTQQTNQNDVGSTIKNLQDNKILSTSIARFDSADRLVEMAYMNPNGSVVSVFKWTYLPTNAVKQIEHWWSGGSWSKENYFYRHGKLVKIEERNESGDLMSRTLFDKAGQPYLEEHFENKQRISRTTYLKDGMIRRSDTFDTKQSIITSTINTYQYDRRGNWVKQTEQTTDKRTGNSSTATITRDIQYYARLR